MLKQFGKMQIQGILPLRYICYISKYVVTMIFLGYFKFTVTATWADPGKMWDRHPKISIWKLIIVSLDTSVNWFLIMLGQEYTQLTVWLPSAMQNSFVCLILASEYSTRHCLKLYCWLNYTTLKWQCWMVCPSLHGPLPRVRQKFNFLFLSCCLSLRRFHKTSVKIASLARKEKKTV